MGGEKVEDRSATGIQPLTGVAELDQIIDSGTLVLFKHSTACWISTMAWRHIRRFSKKVPDVPIYVVNVITQRDLSEDISERFGIRHESPQAIVLREGESVWHASHLKVNTEALEIHAAAT